MTVKSVLSRLIEERRNLSEKCDLLNAFLEDEDNEEQVSEYQLYLMDRQLDAMNLYLHFLEERINDLTEDEEEGEETKKEDKEEDTEAKREIKLEDDCFKPSEEILDFIKGFARATNKKSDDVTDGISITFNF